MDAILFDKDGTLMDFDAFWVPVTIKAVEYVLTHLHRKDIPIEEFLVAFGIHNGVTDIEGVLCKGTYLQLGQCVFHILNKHKCNIPLNNIVELVEKAFNANITAGEIKPSSPNLPHILAALKKRNKKLGVITTDNAFITQKCLKVLGIENQFDIIYTADGTLPPKPDPACALDFCQSFEINKERVVMIGDTMTDILFSKNAGIAMIGIAKDKQNNIFETDADAVIPNLSALLDLLE